MPRGVKGSGEAKDAKTTVTTKRPYHRKAAPVVNETATQATQTTAAQTVATIEAPVAGVARKPYPTVAERIALADKQIARLTALNASRAALVEKTAKLLNERQDALAKSMAALEKAESKRLKLVATANKPPKSPKQKLTPEERKARMAAGREAKRLEREKVEALMAALKDSGKSVDELLAEFKG